MIRLENVTKLYKTVIGVNDLTLEMPEGTYGLIGPNGSGKTTLINLLTGNLKPTIGSVQVEGANPWKNRRVLGKIGLCPTNDLLCPNVTALQWVSYLTGMAGYSRSEANRRAIDSLEKVGMKGAMHQPISSYSLGMRQRTKLAQAISHDPKWLILDEPFNGLDPVGRLDLAKLLQHWSESGRGLILASHVLHEVEAVTKSFLLIHGGRILASGDANEVQSMLVDFPQEIQIRGKQLEQLASTLVLEPWVSSLRFHPDRSMVTVAVNEPRMLFQRLQSFVMSSHATIYGIDAPDGNLATAFESLLKVHRGEV